MGDMPSSSGKGQHVFVEHAELSPNDKKLMDHRQLSVLAAEDR